MSATVSVKHIEEVEADVPVPSDEAYERMSREFWSRREPGHEDVTITVRRGGLIVRTVLLEPGRAAVSLPAETGAGVPPAGGR